MSGGGKQSGTQKTQVAPPEFAVGNLTDLVSQIGAANRGGNLQLGQQNTVLQDFTPEELLAHQKALQAAGQQQTIADNSLAALTEALSLPDNIIDRPEVSGAITAAQRPIEEQLTRVALPGIATGAIGAGQSGGSRQGIAEGLAIQGAQNASADVSSSIASNALSQALNARTQALFASPQIQGLQLTPATTTAQVGGDIRALNQSLDAEQQQVDNANSLLEFDALQRYASLLAPLIGGFSNQNTTTTGPGGPGRFQGFAGGALSGAGAGASFGGPTGALIGGALGGIAGGLS